MMETVTEEKWQRSRKIIMAEKYIQDGGYGSG